MTSVTSSSSLVVYPESDGQPMANNTEQFDELTALKYNLEALFTDRDDVFVAGDLLWYPVEGNNNLKAAPDVFVAFGRPKGRRGSYLQWKEDDIAPQVAVEIISPGNTTSEMINKLLFYDKYGIEEYYVYTPATGELTVLTRDDEGHLRPRDFGVEWMSPLLGIRFVVTENAPWQLFAPDGTRFPTMDELVRLPARIKVVQQEATEARQEATEARQEAIEAQQRAERLAEQLRALGIDPGA